MLTVRGLKRLGIGPVDLTLEGGEIVALTGPSGAGKSLLLRAIADLDPAEGEYTLAGENRRAMTAPQWRRRVMYVPAQSGWWDDTVEPHFQGVERTRAVDILHRLGMQSTALGWRVANLSTGERQRLSLARALSFEPDVLLLDEPTSGLDPENVKRAEKLIQSEAENGRAMIIVTHDADQAARLSGRIHRLDGGQLILIKPRSLSAREATA